MGCGKENVVLKEEWWDHMPTTGKCLNVSYQKSGKKRGADQGKGWDTVSYAGQEGNPCENRACGEGYQVETTLLEPTQR